MIEPVRTSTKQPVLGFVLFGGSLTGALVRDVRLANECSARGYPVHVWWVMDRQANVGLRPEIQQHLLINGLRFLTRVPMVRGMWESIGRVLSSIFSQQVRAHVFQRRPRLAERLMSNLTRDLCAGVENDAPVIRRFGRQMREHGVTHMLPMLEMLCLWTDAARASLDDRPKLLVTFQGYELYSTYARSLGLEQRLYQQLAACVERSDYPAIAVSEDYRLRVHEEIGVPLGRLVAIPPGVPAAKRMENEAARQALLTKFKDYQPDVPLIAFLGRRDTEKGIDLLLYAAKILEQRGVKFQIAICGPTLWGDHYGGICRKIAEELRINIMWRRFVPNEVRSALFVLAHCVVYPSIHREPFGMVAAEAAAHGTPAIVPDHGGVASAIEAMGGGESAGVRFKSWDSGDLAAQIERLLTDRALHQRLSEAGPRVAEHYSIPNLADRVLTHIGLPTRREASSRG